MNTPPTDLQIVEDNALLIKWSDGQRRRYSSRDLRDVCPCATCREKRTGKQQGPYATVGVFGRRSRAATDRRDKAPRQLCLRDRLQRRARHGDLFVRSAATTKSNKRGTGTSSWRFLAEKH